MNAKVDSQATTARPMMKTALQPLALIREHVLMASITTHVFALLGLLVPTARPMFHPATRNHVEMVVAV